MTYIIVSLDKKWRSQWVSLLQLVAPSRKHLYCTSLAEFAKLELEEKTIIYIDCKSVGLPQYLPYNPSPTLSSCSFVLVNTGILPDKGLLHFLKIGFNGVIKGGEKPEVTLKALESLSRQESWFPRRIVEQAVRDYQKSSTTQEQVVYELAAAYNLSKREQQVCMALIEGDKNCEIGNKLFISKHTVKCHVTSLYRKLDINSRHEILAAINRRLKRPAGLSIAS